MTKFIEIGITILVDIFKGIKKHCEKRTHRNHEYQDSKDSTSTPRNVECFLKLSWPESEITNLSKNGTLPILTCALGLLVSKFVLNHFFSSVEQNGVQIVLFERLAHFKLFKIWVTKISFKIFYKRAEWNLCHFPSLYTKHNPTNDSLISLVQLLLLFSFRFSCRRKLFANIIQCNTRKFAGVAKLRRKRSRT